LKGFLSVCGGKLIYNEELLHCSTSIKIMYKE